MDLNDREQLESLLPPRNDYSPYRRLVFDGFEDYLRLHLILTFRSQKRRVAKLKFCNTPFMELLCNYLHFAEIFLPSLTKNVNISVLIGNMYTDTVYLDTFIGTDEDVFGTINDACFHQITSFWVDRDDHIRCTDFKPLVVNYVAWT